MKRLPPRRRQSRVPSIIAPPLGEVEARLSARGLSLPLSPLLLAHSSQPSPLFSLTMPKSAYILAIENLSSVTRCRDIRYECEAFGTVLAVR